jgi:hypothetical protein
VWLKWHKALSSNSSSTTKRKSHDEQNINILNKDKILSHTTLLHPNPGPGKNALNSDIKDCLLSMGFIYTLDDML